jgi:hypothetical protein
VRWRLFKALKLYVAVVSVVWGADMVKLRWRLFNYVPGPCWYAYALALDAIESSQFARKLRLRGVALEHDRASRGTCRTSHLQTFSCIRASYEPSERHETESRSPEIAILAFHWNCSIAKHPMYDRLRLVCRIHQLIGRTSVRQAELQASIIAVT